MKSRIASTISALSTSALLIGATLTGAYAQLETYPQAWITDGVFDGNIVIGADAATSDMLGAIDIAASIQAASVREVPIDVPLPSLEGDVIQVGRPNSAHDVTFKYTSV